MGTTADIGTGNRVRWQDELPQGIPGNSRWILATTGLFCLQALDLLTTRLVIDNGGVELNPVFSGFQPTIWFWPIMSVAKILFLSWAYFSLTLSDQYYPRAAWVTCLILVFQSIFVAGNNIMVLLQLS